MVINLLLVIFAYKTKALTFKAITLAFILGVIVCYSCIEAYIVLFFYFILITTIERIVLKDKGEKRNSNQVLSNFIFALVSLILHLTFDQHCYFVLYCSVLSVSMCDTLASIIGTRFAKNVYSITRFKRVGKGVSGGVSFCGSLSGALGSAIIALIYYMTFFRRPNISVVCNTLTILLLGVLGMSIDSILGDLVQKKYYCSQCQKATDNEICCGKISTPIGVQLLTNSQVNIISEGLIFVLGLLII